MNTEALFTALMIARDDARETIATFDLVTQTVFTTISEGLPAGPDVYATHINRLNRANKIVADAKTIAYYTDTTLTNVQVRLAD
jgi:hypothetical protein